MPVLYHDSADAFDATEFEGFCVGWSRPLSGSELLHTLRSSYAVVVATDEDRHVLGFINAISDGVLSAFIPLLEVRPEHQAQGIGRELVQRMLARLDGLYSIDLVCDDHLVGYYETLGLERLTGMGKRNRAY